MMITSSMMGNTESETEQRNDDSCCGIMVYYDCRILEKLTPYSKLLVCKLQVLQVLLSTLKNDHRWNED